MTETVRISRYPIDARAEKILAASLAEFSGRGVRDARLSVIARRAGVSLPTLRQYFPSRDDLFREVIRSTLIRSIREQPPPPAPDRPVADQLREFARQFFRAQRAPDRAALLRLSLSELHAFPELAVFHSTEVIGRAVRQLESLLGEGVRRGEVRPLDVRITARVIHAALVSYALWLAAPEVYGELTGPDRDAAEDAVIDALIWALGGPHR